MFPRDTTYSCPGPSLRLKCSEGISFAWASPGVFNVGDEPGHAINNSIDGVSYLYVNTSSVLKSEYRCIAIAPNGTSHERTVLTPSPVGKRLHNM